MIAGIGIDMVEVERIARLINERDGFMRKVFSENEIRYCEQMAHPSEHFAARFAAKEAFLKATGEGLALGFELCHIEIVNDRSGKPQLVLHGAFRRTADERNWRNFHVSLSHVKNNACAVVLIES